jgi:hypothetical protein
MTASRPSRPVRPSRPETCRAAGGGTSRLPGLAALVAAATALLLAPDSGVPADAGDPVAPVAGTPAAADTSTDRRAIPYPLVPSRAYRQAVARGTRTASGRAGPDYWTNTARYRIEASLDTAAHRISGRAEITYLNRSPEALERIAVHLRQNLFAPGAVRRDDVPVTGGVELERVSAAGRELPQAGSGDAPSGAPTYQVDGTVAWLDLPGPLASGDSVELAVEWSHEVPPRPSDGRQGREPGLYFMGYWYPQVAVYDDVSGWVAEAYTGQGEFYMGQADYDVRLTVPAGWPVEATGELQNPEEVLSERSRERIARARQTGEVVPVIGPGERGDGAATVDTSGSLTWHYTAESVRDFAWTASRSHLWDATRALVQDNSGSAAPETVMSHSCCRPTEEAAAWPGPWAAPATPGTPWSRSPGCSGPIPMTR